MRANTENIINTQIGKFLPLAKNYDSGYLRYTCKCLKCGEKSEIRYSDIIKWKDGGCAKCRKKLKDKERLKKLKEEHVNKKHGQLLIEDISLHPTKSGQIAYALCLCDCKNKKEILLRRVLEGGAVTCGHNCTKQLNEGRRISKMAAAGSSSVLAVSDRGLNKNSTTGIKGVSWMPKIGKYRAYITYKYKQYHLGSFDTLEEATKARKTAEKNIHGSFLKWYADTYPEKWEELQKHLAK